MTGSESDTMKTQSQGLTSALFITPTKLRENKNLTNSSCVSSSVGPGEVKIAAFETDDGIQPFNHQQRIDKVP